MATPPHLAYRQMSLLVDTQTTPEATEVHQSFRTWREVGQGSSNVVPLKRTCFSIQHSGLRREFQKFIVLYDDIIILKMNDAVMFTLNSVSVTQFKYYQTRNTIIGNWGEGSALHRCRGLYLSYVTQKITLFVVFDI